MHPCVGTAYEFKHINHLFSILSADYAGTLDIKKLSLSSVSILNKFDRNLKLYYSDSKAFLYYKGQLTATFDLPKNNDLMQWQHTLDDILSACLLQSPKISNRKQALENELLQEITKNLDLYSRIEKPSSSLSTLDYTIKDNILYIKFIRFDKKNAENLKSIISQNQNVLGLILDLRGNHGGNFSEAIKTADLFLDNTLIVYSSEKNHPNRYYTSSEGDVLNGKPIVVLTDEYTASAAEIVAAALSEQSRATLVGTKTYGKGSIQQIHTLDNQVLYLTSGYFFSPSGRPIHQKGILPQVCTGKNNSCQFSDKTNPQKDILTAVNLIKQSLS